MYFTVKNNEDIELINEYLLTKYFINYKINDDCIERIQDYKTENIKRIFTKNQYDSPNVRHIYYWFDNEYELNDFILRMKQSTINKYKKYYEHLYVDFEKKLQLFKPNYIKKTESSIDIDELSSMTITYYNLEKHVNLFKHKYEKLNIWEKDKFLNYDCYDEKFSLIKLKEPSSYILNESNK